MENSHVLAVSNEPLQYDEIIDCSGFLLVPGFIDMHVHGGGGADFMDGTEDAVRKILRTHLACGTTGLLATTLTASGDATGKAITAIAAAAKEPRLGESAILGIHLEGPYICQKRRGAQPEAFVRPPDLNELRQWIDLSGGLVKQITIAPEMPGALEFIRKATALGVICSIGHTDASFVQTQAAIDAGARQATHLFNAMSGFHHREPGAAGALLDSDQVTAELICDGVHLHPGAVELAVKTKTPERCVLITDAMEAAGMPDGQYSLGGQQVLSKNGVAAFPDGTLAGSVLTMDLAFGNVQKFARVSAWDASLMASLIPARQLGISDSRGSIDPGKIADIVALDPSSGKVQLVIAQGMIAHDTRRA
jgi:N-acetylglucosamine-6-phosphate deacetylase